MLKTKIQNLENLTSSQIFEENESEWTGPARTVREVAIALNKTSMPAPAKIEKEIFFYFTQEGWDEYGQKLWCKINDPSFLQKSKHKNIKKRMYSFYIENAQILYADEYQVALPLDEKARFSFLSYKEKESVSLRRLNGQEEKTACYSIA